MNDPATRAVWLAIAILTALLVAAATGVLVWIESKKAPRALLAGGAAFGGTLLLALGSIAFVANGT